MHFQFSKPCVAFARPLFVSIKMRKSNFSAWLQKCSRQRIFLSAAWFIYCDLGPYFVSVTITDLRIMNVSWLRENKCYNILLCWFDGFLTNKVWIFCTYNLATSALSGTVAHPLHWLFLECYNKKGMVQASFVCKFLALCTIIRSKILTRKPEC